MCHWRDTQTAQLANPLRGEKGNVSGHHVLEVGKEGDVGGEDVELKEDDTDDVHEEGLQVGV